MPTQKHVNKYSEQHHSRVKKQKPKCTSTDEMDKSKVIQPYKGMLFSPEKERKEERNPDPCY